MAVQFSISRLAVAWQSSVVSQLRQEAAVAAETSEAEDTPQDKRGCAREVIWR